MSNVTEDARRTVAHEDGPAAQESALCAAAFAKAWAFVETDAVLQPLAPAERRSALALIVSTLGPHETNPTRLANSAIAHLRRSAEIERLRQLVM